MRKAIGLIKRLIVASIASAYMIMGAAGLDVIRRDYIADHSKAINEAIGSWGLVVVENVTHWMVGMVGLIFIFVLLAYVLTLITVKFGSGGNKTGSC